MKLTHFLPYLFAMLVMFGCENESNKAQDDTVENQEAMANDAGSANADVDQDELWDTSKSEEFVKENAHTHLRILEITKAGQNAGFGEEINKLTSKAMQVSQSAYGELQQVAGTMNVTLADGLTQDEIDGLDMEKYGNGEKDDIGEDYLEALIKEYKDLIDDYEDAAEKGATAEIRQHASNMLQSLETDLMSIEALEKEID